MLEKEILCKLQKSCLIHVAISDRSLQWVQNNPCSSLQKVEPSSTLCSCCKPKKSCETSYKEGILHAAPTCNFSCNAISTQVTKKLAPCNTICGAQFYFLQRFQKFFRAIASYSPRLQNFLEPLQVAALLFFIVADGMIHKLCYRLAVACFKNNNSTNEVFKLNAWSRLWK